MMRLRYNLVSDRPPIAGGWEVIDDNMVVDDDVTDGIINLATIIGNKPENANEYLKQVCQKEVRK